MQQRNINRGCEDDMKVGSFYIFLLSILYVILLNFTYSSVTSPSFSYLGYINLHPSISILMISGFIATIPSLWMPIKLKRPSQLVYWILYVLVYIPTSVIPYFILNVSVGKLLIFNSILLIVFYFFGYVQRLRLIRIANIEMPSSIFWIGVYLSSLFLYSLVGYTFGFSFKLIGLSEVYDVRGDYRETLASTSALVAYGIAWQANVINPLLISQGLVSKNLFNLLFGIFGQLLIFSITGFKSVLFSSLFILAILFALKNRGKIFGLLIITGTVGLVLITSTVAIVFQNGYLSSLLVRRLIITPGLLTGYYYDFFSSHSKTMLGHSIFKGFIDYPYSLDPPFLIGQVYFNSAAKSANANIWADSFANFGFIGIILFTLLLGMILWLYDSLTVSIDYRVACLMLGIPAISLSNSALLTSMLTHGIMLAVLLVYLMPKKGIAIKESNIDVKQSMPHNFRSSA
jgi:hypothetical protein